MAGSPFRLMRPIWRPDLRLPDGAAISASACRQEEKRPADMAGRKAGCGRRIARVPFVSCASGDESLEVDPSRRLAQCLMPPRESRLPDLEASLSDREGSISVRRPAVRRPSRAVARRRTRLPPQPVHPARFREPSARNRARPVGTGSREPSATCGPGTCGRARHTTAPADAGVRRGSGSWLMPTTAAAPTTIPMAASEPYGV